MLPSRPPDGDPVNGVEVVLQPADVVVAAAACGGWETLRQALFLRTADMSLGYKDLIRGIDLERVKAAAETEGDFIKLLPKDYETYIGARGSSVSGGQKQRLASARILDQRSSVLSMDEATSALDNKSEQLVRQAVERVMQNHLVIERTDAVNRDSITGEVKFCNISFQCKDGLPLVLNGVDLNIKAGQTVALVGPSGGGKTTLVKLLLRLYDPLHGCILIDGHDIQSLRLESLRSHVALVSQNITSFSGTVAENIGFKDLIKGSDFRRVKAAAETANADEFIKLPPKGDKTYVGARGSSLSAGQKQRPVSNNYISNTKGQLAVNVVDGLLVDHEAADQHGLSKEASILSTRTLLTKWRNHSIIMGCGISSGSLTGNACRHVKQDGVRSAWNVILKKERLFYHLQFMLCLVDNFCLIFGARFAMSLRESSEGKSQLQTLQSLCVHIDHVLMLYLLCCALLGTDFNVECVHLFYSQLLSARAEVREFLSEAKQLIWSQFCNLTCISECKLDAVVAAIDELLTSVFSGKSLLKTVVKPLNSVRFPLMDSFKVKLIDHSVHSTTLGPTQIAVWNFIFKYLALGSILDSKSESATDKGPQQMKIPQDSYSDMLQVDSSGLEEVGFVSEVYYSFRDIAGIAILGILTLLVGLAMFGILMVALRVIVICCNVLLLIALRGLPPQSLSENKISSLSLWKVATLRAFGFMIKCSNDNTGQCGPSLNNNSNNNPAPIQPEQQEQQPNLQPQNNTQETRQALVLVQEPQPLPGLVVPQEPIKYWLSDGFPKAYAALKGLKSAWKSVDPKKIEDPSFHNLLREDPPTDPVQPEWDEAFFEALPEDVKEELGEAFHFDSHPQKPAYPHQFRIHGRYLPLTGSEFLLKIVELRRRFKLRQHIRTIVQSLRDKQRVIESVIQNEIWQGVLAGDLVKELSKVLGFRPRLYCRQVDMFWLLFEVQYLQQQQQHLSLNPKSIGVG